jgi:hypothetical protein
MGKRQDNGHKEIGAANMLRLYDTELIERLNRRFNESENRYEHKNHFLTDLIEAGLNRREYENSLRDELIKNDAAMYRSVDELSLRLTALGEYIRTQFQSMSASNYVVTALLSNICFLSEATNFGMKLPRDNVLSGTYNELPERFQKLKTTAEQVYLKDE